MDTSREEEQTDQTNNEPDNDGVVLSVRGSDDKFAKEEDDDNQDQAEPGEVLSSDNDMDYSPQPQVRSKVSKVTSTKRKSSLLDKFEYLRHDPDFKVFLNDVLDEREDRRKLSEEQDQEGTNRKKNTGTKGTYVANNEENEKLVGKTQLMKSPSDSTLYSPGLRRLNKEGERAIIDRISNFVESIHLDAVSGNGKNRVSRHHRQDTEIRMNSISSPIESNIQNGNNYRLQSGELINNTVGVQKTIDQEQQHFNMPLFPNVGWRESGDVCRVERVVQECHPSTSQSREDKLQSDRVADQLIVQAEKFKARIEAPKGKHSDLLLPYDYDSLKTKFVRQDGLAPLDSEILFLRNFDQDDEFFHKTSQIEPNLRTKIERGEFIDLERLLPKERSTSKLAGEDLNRQLYQLITQGTNNYLEPRVQKKGKISGIKKWDQAFRVYAAIYTDANPDRSSEIWQYIYVIHTAAAANPWENVYYYDINFRELMASKPWRSWGKTYMQGWNMAFNNANHQSQGCVNSHFNSGPSKGVNSNNTSSKSWKDNCCWRFNKNRCNRNANDCNFDHRCTYCAGWNHSFYNCRKRQAKVKKSGVNVTNRSANNNANGSSPKLEK